jgi:hypothetical protein
MAGGTNEVEIPVFVRASLAPGNDVISREPRTTAAARSAANPAISFRDAACESTLFFVFRIEGRCGGIGAEHLGTHQFESLCFREGLSGESLAGFMGLLPLLEHVALEHEDECLLSHRG